MEEFNMSELKKLVVVSAENDEKGVSLKLQVAELDYSAIYDCVVYFKQYDKENEEWLDFDETTDQGKKALERVEKAREVLGGFDNLEDKEVELWVDEESGKAYPEEAKGFIKVEKPLKKLKGLKRLPIVAIKDSAKGRQVIVEHKGTNYGYNYNYGVYIDKLNKFIENKAKLAKAKENFNDDFQDVSLDWETAPKAIEKAYNNSTPFVVDCEAQENKLDPKSPYGWIKGSALFDGDNEEAMQSLLKPDDEPKDKKPHVSDDLTDDDLPF